MTPSFAPIVGSVASKLHKDVNLITHHHFCNFTGMLRVYVHPFVHIFSQSPSVFILFLLTEVYSDVISLLISIFQENLRIQSHCVCTKIRRKVSDFKATAWILRVGVLRDSIILILGLYNLAPDLDSANITLY